MKRLICLFFCCAALAQPDIATIVENDPFDPNRGRKEAVEEEVAPEEAPVPVDVPVLDGTMIIGKKKIALFTYMEEGKKRYMSASINEVVAGYKITDIADREVVLFGNGSPVNVRLFSGEKASRGGTKKSQAKASSKKGKGPNAKNKKAESVIVSPSAKKKDAKKPDKKRFVPRKNPTKKPDKKKTNEKAKKYKSRF